MNDHLTPPIEEPEIVRDTAPQEMVHAYDKDGNYQGQMVATPTQLLEMGMTAGDAPVPDMALLKAAAIERVKKYHAETLSRLTGNPSTAETATWTIKEAAARAYIDGNATTTQTAMLTLEASATGSTVDVLATGIIGKADIYYQLVGTAGGLHQKAKALINACTTGDELEKVMTAITEGTATATAEFMAAQIKGMAAK